MSSERAADVAAEMGPPMTPSRRLPLIHSALQQAEVMYVELVYEGCGATGGYVIAYQDRHKRDSRGPFLAPDIQQSLTGTLWALVRRRHPLWDQGAGSFGVIYWDVRADRLQHYHHQRIVDVKTSLIEGL